MANLEIQKGFKTPKRLTNSFNNRKPKQLSIGKPSKYKPGQRAK